ncbi:DNA-directed DNA polymerase [Gracilaria domingensis]|nr:DNA-directed DNA polymerase [Gracilaria domingensis]
MRSKATSEAPMSNAENGIHAIQRKTAIIDATPSKRFLLPPKKKYEPQYAHIYFCRLTALRPAVEAASQESFGPPSEKLRYAKRIVNVSGEDVQGIESVIIGVVFRQMNKPSILSLYEQPSHDLIPSPPPRSSTPYPGSDDLIFLEDENGRCTLDVSALDPVPDSFVTGFVVAVKGAEDRTTGTFKVAGFSSVLPAPQMSLKPYPEDTYICLLSSLSVSTPSFSLELLLEFLKGNTLEEDEGFQKNIVSVVIAGNLIPHVDATPMHKPLAVGDKERIASPMVDADRFLSGLASTVPVFHMPGENDATNYLLPQQPLHRCLLPSSSRNSNFKRVPNPFACSFGGRLLLATSGQNVSDFSLYQAQYDTEKKDETFDMKEKEKDFEPSGERVTDILESMLNNRHIAPTCPDTLGAYPFYEMDPFIVENTPHIFVTGNQKEFGTRTMNVPREPSQESNDEMDIDGDLGGFVRLVSVPRFDTTGQAVFVNLKNMECFVREFGFTM